MHCLRSGIGEVAQTDRHLQATIAGRARDVNSSYCQLAFWHWQVEYGGNPMAVDHDGKMPFDKVTSTQKKKHVIASPWLCA